MHSFPDFHIYPVITEQFCKNSSAIQTLKECLAAGIKIVQLRSITVPSIYLAQEFRELTTQYGATLIINNYLDLALTVKADGVHLGQEDLPCKIARRLAPGLIIGVSTHNLKEALQAQKDGATYINIGPIFSTQTKTLPMPPLGLDSLTEISAKISIPYTVMGGIKSKHIPELVKLGATRFAMVTEITMTDDMGAKIQELENIARHQILH